MKNNFPPHVCWLKEGETNSAFFKIHAAHRLEKNCIFSIKQGDRTVSDKPGMSKATYLHFSTLGTPCERKFSIDLGQMDDRNFNLFDLEHPFIEEEIWQAVKALPRGKAPGPDGFTSEFKADICEVFDKFFSLNGRSLERLTEALVTLLPKKPDAFALSDYRPISLIYLVVKLIAKVISLCLAPQLS